MPIHSCSHAALKDKVAEIESGPERIIGLDAANDDTVYILTYLPTPRGKETR